MISNNYCWTEQVVIIFLFLLQQIIEEARRMIGIVADNDRCKLKDDCLKRLIEEVQAIIYHGIDSKGISPPKSPKLSKYFFYKINKKLSCIYQINNKGHAGITNFRKK
jgi:hypothetical protein